MPNKLMAAHLVERLAGVIWAGDCHNTLSDLLPKLPQLTVLWQHIHVTMAAYIYMYIGQHTCTYNIHIVLHFFVDLRLKTFCVLKALWLTLSTITRLLAGGHNVLFITDQYRIHWERVNKCRNWYPSWGVLLHHMLASKSRLTSPSLSVLSKKLNACICSN